jgi:hypothetical protein
MPNPKGAVLTERIRTLLAYVGIARYAHPQPSKESAVGRQGLPQGPAPALPEIRCDFGKVNGGGAGNRNSLFVNS